MSRRDEVGGEDGEPSTPISAATPDWLADTLAAEAGKHVPDIRRIRAVMRDGIESVDTVRSRKPLRGFALLRGLPRRFAGVPAGIAAGVLCVAMVFAVATMYDSGRSGSSAPPGMTAPPLAGSNTDTSDGAPIVTATGTVDAASRTGWSQEDVAITFAQPVAGFQLSVKVSLASTGSSAGYSSTYDASLFTVTVDKQAHALVYKFNLKPGTTLPPGPSRFAVQFNYENPHDSAHDTYYVSVYTDKAHGRVPDVAQGAF